MTEEHLRQLGARIEAARLSRGWSKEGAAREARISTITWNRIVDGLGVQDAKRAAALHALDLDENGLPLDDRPMYGLDPATVDLIRQAVAEEVEKHLREAGSNP